MTSAARFRTPIEKHKDPHRQRALNRRVAPVVLRRTKDLVASELPPKTELTHAHRAAPAAQADLYETVRVAMDEQGARRHRQPRAWRKSQIIFLDALLKLRQVCCDPRLLKTDAAAKVDQSAKLDFLHGTAAAPCSRKAAASCCSRSSPTCSAVIEASSRPRKSRYLKLTGETQDRGDADPAIPAAATSRCS